MKLCNKYTVLLNKTLKHIGLAFKQIKFIPSYMYLKALVLFINGTVLWKL